MEEAKFNSIVGDSGKFFTVKFFKVDNSIRTMTARCKVKRYVKGVLGKGKVKTPGLITAWEPQAGKGSEAYRSFYASTIIELHANGHKYDSEGNEIKSA